MAANADELVEAASLPRRRFHVEVELGTAPLVLDVGGDLLAKEAVEVVAVVVVVVVVAQAGAVCVERVAVVALALVAVVVVGLVVVLLVVVEV